MRNFCDFLRKNAIKINEYPHLNQLLAWGYKSQQLLIFNGGVCSAGAKTDI